MYIQQIDKMSRIQLPWDTETIVESTKSQLVAGGSSSSQVIPVVTALISNLKSPTEFALIITADEEKAPETATGFMATLKSMASSAATTAIKTQRQVTAGCNKLASVYDVKLILPVTVDVDFTISAGSLICSWTEIGTGRDSAKRSVRINNLSNKFISAFTASKEISVEKLGNQLVPNGLNSSTFRWLWKFQPIVPLPKSPLQSLEDELYTPPTVCTGKVMCLSWNLAGLPPPDDNPLNVVPTSFSKYKTSLISFLKKHSDVTVIVLALQEASPLNAKTVLFKGADDNYGEAWLEWFLDVFNCSHAIRGTAEWVKTTGIVQVGLAVSLLVKNNLKEDSGFSVTAPYTSSVKTGTLGLTGNKGCVGLRSTVTFSQNSAKVSIAALNIHLASGEGKSDFRRNELAKVANESSFTDDKSIHFFDSDLCIVTGDLNSRINEEVDCDGSNIIPEDELITRMRDEGDGFPFCEKQINFPATYKLVPGEGGRAVFVMNRKPGWCDRVLFRSGSCGDIPHLFRCTEYSSLRELDLSDHTPVFAVFSYGEFKTGQDPKSAVPTLLTNDQTTSRDDDDDDSDLIDK